MRTTILQIPTVALHPHPSNPRRDLGDLVELADSMRAHGVRQALVAVPYCDQADGGDCSVRVKTADGTAWCTRHQAAGVLRVVIGHRRLAAARMADLPDVPTIIDHDLTAADQLELMLVENVQRRDLTPIEEAGGYQLLLDLGVEKTMIARKTGRSRTTVDRRLKLLTLPEEAREMVHTRQASLEDAAMLLDIAEKAPDLADDLAGALGTPSLGWRVREAQQAIDHRAKLVESIALVEKHGATAWDGVTINADGDTTTDGDADPDGYQYHREIAHYAGKFPAAGDDLTGWLYHATVGGHLYLYKPDAKTGDDPMRQAEEARKREADLARARRDKLTADAQSAYDRRTEFVRSLLTRRRWTDADTETIGSNLAYTTTTRGMYLHPTPELLGLERKPGWKEGIPGLPWQALAVACLHEDAGLIIGWWTGTAGVPGSGAGREVQDFYRIIEQLGYVLSDGERHYIYGEPLEMVEG